MRFRTLPQALEEIKKEDPETALTHYTLQRWVKCGVIPASKRGTHFIIDLDVLIDRLKEGIK